MWIWDSFLVGLLSGVIATLLADNPHVRFYIEKAVRSIFRRPLVSVRLVSFTDHCDSGLLLTHCIELKNNIWLTSNIPRTYFLSWGTLDYDSHAYKPFVYFRSRGIRDKSGYAPAQLLEECAKKIVPYSPDDPSLGMTISRSVPMRIAVICETIVLDNSNPQVPMNHRKIVGRLHAAVANPMPNVSPGAWWNMRIISEDFGLIDNLHIGIPDDWTKENP